MPKNKKKNRNKTTSPRVASDAAPVLSDPKSTPKKQEVGASALSQAAPNKGKKGKK